MFKLWKQSANLAAPQKYENKYRKKGNIGNSLTKKLGGEGTGKLHINKYLKDTTRRGEEAKILSNKRPKRQKNYFKNLFPPQK